MNARHEPTAEQAAIIDAYRTGAGLVIEAGAGTGKTSTLKMLAAASPGRRGLYIAYNRAIADDAKRDFPRDVQCATAHSLAYGAVGRQFRHRLNGPRVPARETARLLRINEPIKVGEVMLAPHQIARVAAHTVNRFCRSADPDIGPWHVPTVTGLESDVAKAELRSCVTPIAKRAWEDITSVDGRLRFEHDHYLKLWQLSVPRLPVDYVLLDEAQDASPVIASIVEDQSQAQRIMVGDRSQAIYGWRGAVDAMSRFAAENRLRLSQSFRFGAAIAGEANKWLSVLAAELRLRGFERINSTVASLPTADAVLCRTNAHAVSEAINAMDSGARVALAGGGAEIRRLAQAAVTLKAGIGTDHPELFAFRNWAEVQDYVDNDPGGSDLKVFVQLIDSRGPEVVIDTVDRLVDERRADLIVSTAHKAKGREWERVRIATDFREPKDNPETGQKGEITPDEAMLAYVAVTRARLTLDRSGLAWIDNWVEAPAQSPGDAL